MKIFWGFSIVLCFVSCGVKPIDISQTVPQPVISQLSTTGDSSVQDSILNPLSIIYLIEAAEAKHLGEVDKAIFLYGKAIEADPLNDAAHFELATIYQLREQFDVDLAIKNSKRAAEIDPSNEVYQIVLGRLLVDSNQASEGVGIFEKLVANNPKRRDYAFDLAFAYESAERFDDAIQVFDNIESTYGYDPEINYQKHVLYFNKGDRKNGIAEIEEIVEKNPEFTTYTLFVAKYYLETGDLANADKYATSAYDQEPNAESFEILSIAKIYQNNQAELNQLLSSVVQSDLEVDQKVLQIKSLLDIYRQSPEWREVVLDNVKELTLQHPDRAEPHALYGDFLYLDSRNEEAVKSYKQSLTKRQDVYDVWAQVIDIYVYENNYTDLAPFATKASQQFSQNPFPTYMAGYANYRIKEHGTAISILEKAVNTEYEDKDFDLLMLGLLADSYHENKQYDQAYLTYDRVLIKSPDDTHVLNNYSYFLADRKLQLEKAKKMAARALELNPDDANALDTYGWVLLQKGEFEMAEQAFKRATTNDPTSATIIEHYGDALFENKKISEALVQWQKALNLDSSNESLKTKINKINR